jgi:ribosomal protein S18 acetylase RimI-like enzyme
MIHFKSLENSDVATVVKMMQDFYAIDNYPFDVQIAKKLLIEFLSNENFGKCWLILEDEKTIGYVILTFIFSFEYKGKIAFVDECYIDETFRGKGIGKTTIQFIQKEAKELSLKLLYLEVENHNEIAQKMYLSQDFEFHNRTIMKFDLINIF